MAAGVNPIVLNDNVGVGLADHPLVPLYYQVNSNATWDTVLQDDSVFNADLAEWMANKTGLFVNSPGNTQSFLRIPDDDPIFKLYKDPAAGPNSAHLETIYVVCTLISPQTSTGGLKTCILECICPSRIHCPRHRQLYHASYSPGFPNFS